MTKNILKKFRRDNGYESGNYINTWELNPENGPVEDEEICLELVSTILAENNEDMSFLPTLLEIKLAEYYCKVQKNDTQQIADIPPRLALH